MAPIRWTSHCLGSRTDDKLAPINDRMFPRNTTGTIAVFWVKYWAWFFLLLPWMLLRQAFSHRMRRWGQSGPGTDRSICSTERFASFT